MIPQNIALMKSIRDQYGAAINAACQGCAVPPGLLAALIANESGGNIDAKRFEKNVLASLWEVLLGRKAAYGSIRNADLFLFILPRGYPRDSSDAAAATAVVSYSLQQLDGLATSWGLTQMMGYHVMDHAAPAGTTLDKLRDPVANLNLAVVLLAEFAKQFALDLANDPKDLLNCWNSGHPAGDPKHPTFDPNYVANGLARMQLYAG